MEFEWMPFMDVCDVIDRAAPKQLLGAATLAALQKSFTRLCSDTAARGDVLTPLAPPTYPGSDKNARVGQQADLLVLAVMQETSSRVQTSHGDVIAEVFRGWRRVNQEETSRLHEAFKLCVMRRPIDGRSLFRRVLYNAVLVHVANRDGTNVDIVMRFPDAEKADASVAL